jgi:hypothetical protein
VERAFGILMGSPFFGMDWWVGGCILDDSGVGFGGSFVTDSWICVDGIVYIFFTWSIRTECFFTC